VSLRSLAGEARSLRVGGVVALVLVLALALALAAAAATWMETRVLVLKAVRVPKTVLWKTSVCVRQAAGPPCEWHASHLSAARMMDEFVYICVAWLWLWW
jgi:hypothetical protein